MTQDSEGRMKPFTIVLIVAGVITLLLGVVVGIAILNRPRPITLEVTAPAGEAIVCDLVVDGQPETRGDVAPVRYVFEAREVRFAVIPATAGVGNARVTLSSNQGAGTADGAGIRGNASSGPTGGGITIGGMSREHVENMRAAQAAAREASQSADQTAATASGEQAESSAGGSR